jgi:alpha-amylase
MLWRPEAAVRFLRLGGLATALAACTAPHPAGMHATARDVGPPDRRAADRDVWQAQIVYLVMPDRFFDGDPANDDAGQPGCFDRASPNLFHGGDLAGLRQKIGYLKELGVTAVWSTPFYAQTPLREGACGYHGYWADDVDPDDGAVEPKLGTLAEARALVSDLHAAGMRFILDMVVNHPGRNARIVQQHPEWFHSEATCAQLGDPTVFCPLHGLPDFAQEQPAVADYLTTASRGWVSRLAPDGIRMDTAKHVLPAYLARSWAPGVRSVSGDLFLLAEDFDTGPYAGIAAVLGVGFDSAFNFPLQSALDVAFARGGSVDLVAQRVEDEIAALGLERTLLQTNMIDNHDLPRFLATAPPGTSPEDLAARYALGLVALFTLPGIPQLYAGDELGMIGIAPDNRRDMPAWAWDETGRASATRAPGYVASPQDAFALVRKLATLRTSNGALRRGGYAELWRQRGGKANTYAFFRSDGTNRVLVVLSGDAGASGELSMPFVENPAIAPADKAAWADGTVLKERLGSPAAPSTLVVSGGRIVVNMKAKGAGIYTVAP